MKIKSILREGLKEKKFTGSFSLAQYFTHNWHNIWKIIDIECKTTIKMLQIIYLGYIYEKQACPTHFAVILHR